MTFPLPRFRLAAAALLAPLLLAGCHVVHASRSVAFLGDSLTEGWSYPAVNYGVHGNTTAQMLGRFPAAIPGHGYKQVVILGGTNDVLQHVAPETTVHNLEELGTEAAAQHAEPVLCELPPIFHSYQPEDHADYNPAVNDLNRRIAQLAATHGWKLVDYNTPLAGHPAYSSDGVHLKRKGYLAMERALLRQLSAF